MLAGAWAGTFAGGVVELFVAGAVGAVEAALALLALIALPLAMDLLSEGLVAAGLVVVDVERTGFFAEGAFFVVE